MLPGSRSPPWREARRAGSALQTPAPVQFSPRPRVPRRHRPTFRIGVSYLGGFFLGSSLRRFIKWTLLLGGAVILAIGIGRKLGWFELDWASIECHVRSSLSWLQGEAGAAKQFLTGYLPSAGTAAIGIFLGFGRK